MPLKSLFNGVKFVFFFMWVFCISAAVISLQTVLHYMKRMFDLPVDVINAINEHSNVDNNEEI